MSRTLGWLTLLTLSLFVVTTKAIEEARFSFEDLEALVQKQEWPEALQRLTDVPPAERPKNWDVIVERVNVEYFNQASVQDRTAAETMAKEMEKTFPSLGLSKKFRELRHASAMIGFGACFDVPDDRDECTKRLVEYVKERPADPQLSFLAGKLMGEKYKLDLAFPFFQKAVTPKTREQICSDPLAQRSTIAALSLPKGNAQSQAVKMASGPCWEKMRPALEAELDRAPASKAVSPVCAVLKAKGALKGERARKCSPPEP